MELKRPKPAHCPKPTAGWDYPVWIWTLIDFLVYQQEQSHILNWVLSQNHIPQKIITGLKWQRNFPFSFIAIGLFLLLLFMFFFFNFVSVNIVWKEVIVSICSSLCFFPSFLLSYLLQQFPEAEVIFLNLSALFLIFFSSFISLLFPLLHFKFSPLRKKLIYCVNIYCIWFSDCLEFCYITINIIPKVKGGKLLVIWVGHFPVCVWCYSGYWL